MASLTRDRLQTLLNTLPTTPPAATLPWTNPTADRVLKTTAVGTVELPVPIGGLDLGLGIGAWSAVTAPYSAVAPLNAATYGQYFCLVPPDTGYVTGGVCYDFGLYPVAAPGMPATHPGLFEAQPELVGFTGWLGWACAIDSQGTPWFLCAATLNADPNKPTGLFYTALNQPFQEFLPPMGHYEPIRLLLKLFPVGVWATGDTVWFNTSDDTLWQVSIDDMTYIIEPGKPLPPLPVQISSTGVVQAVYSDNGTPPTFYVLSAVPDGSSYDLVVFPAGDPDSAVTIQSDWALGGIKTTPDGAVWKVVPDMSPTNPQQTAAQVLLLVPPYPLNGQAPTWIDPFANADPNFYPAGLTQTVMDAIPLSATNILLRTTANEAYDNYWSQGTTLSALQLTRVAIGVMDQPAQPFPTYSGDEATAYADISQDLIGASSASDDDIRAHYPSLTAAEADAYYTQIQQLTMPSGFTDATAWSTVQADLSNELYNLVWSMSYWESLTDLVSLRNQIASLALGYVSNIVSVPTLVTELTNNAGLVNGLTIAGSVMGGLDSILSGISSVISSFSPQAAGITGVVSACFGVGSDICTTIATEKSGNTITVSDPMYNISATLGNMELTMGQVFVNTLATIGSLSPAAATDSGILATIGGLVRNGTWSSSIPSMGTGTNTVPELFEAYYNTCVITYFQAFVPVVAAVETATAGGPLASWSGKPVYVGPVHQFQGQGDQWSGALLQYASPSDTSKPLGTDLEVILFTTWQCSYVDVFLNWSIPTTPSWVS